MARYEVIKEITDSLVNVVRLEAKAQKVDVEVVAGPPDEAFFAGKGSRVAVYLYDIHIDHQENQLGEQAEVEESDESGVYTILFPRPLIIRLHFAVAATGKTPIDEQLTLSLALKAFFERPSLDDELKLGSNFPSLDLPVDFDQDFTADKKNQLLQSLGVRHHPLIGYRVVTEMQPQRELRRTRKVERRTIEMFDKIRPPDGMGEGADRSLMKPSVAVKK